MPSDNYKDTTHVPKVHDRIASKSQKSHTVKSGFCKEKSRNSEEHNQTRASSTANFLFCKDNISTNWKNFKQNLLHLEKGDSTVDAKKKKRFRRKKPSECQIGPKVTNVPTDRHLNSNRKEITKVIAIDCEMVGIDTGKDNMLARVSLVNRFGNCIYDKYVLPTEPVVDYRTHVSGVRAIDLQNGEPFETVQKEVAEILRDKILVGHALRNDLKVLYLSHPRRAIRDTSRYKRFRKMVNGGTPGLRKLADQLLGVKIQQGEHDSVIDARAAMQLYLLYRKDWEKDIHCKHKQEK